MQPYLFNQLSYIRGQTLKALDGVSEESALRMPDGFRNSILWQAGHIYVVQERLALLITGIGSDMPEGYPKLLGPGSSPESWAKPPLSLQETRELLETQPERIAGIMRGLSRDFSMEPYTMPTGFVFASPEETLSYALYHEGMHVQAIKVYKKLA